MIIWISVILTSSVFVNTQAVAFMSVKNARKVQITVRSPVVISCASKILRQDVNNYNSTFWTLTETLQTYMYIHTYTHTFHTYVSYIRFIHTYTDTCLHTLYVYNRDLA